MFKCRDSKIIKGMVFAGCSFTWGQGLHYYSNMQTIKEPKPWHYDADLVRLTHYEFIKRNRFPRLVANHFDTFEMCQSFNGGASYSIIEWWEKAFAAENDRQKSLNGDANNPKFDYEDFSHVIFQFTQWARGHSPAMIVPNDQGRIVRTGHFNVMQHPDFFKWLEENNLTADEYIENAIKKDIQDCKEFLQRLESKGLKVYVMSWPFDLMPYIKQDPWLLDRLITFEYEGYRYDDIETLMGPQHSNGRETKNPELSIAFDLDVFSVPPSDHHPSLACHKVIADAIIKRLEQDQK